MTALADHDITARIRHELSGLGVVAEWEGVVLESYDGPKLIDCYATVGKDRIQCAMDTDQEIHYFASDGSRMNLPAPKSYSDNMIFADYVDFLHEETLRVAGNMERRERRNMNLWYGIGLTIAGVLFAVALLFDQGWSAVGAAAAIAITGFLSPFDDYSQRSLSKQIPMETDNPDEKTVEFLGQLNTFTESFGISFAGDLAGVVDCGVSYLIFTGVEKDGKMNAFAVSKTATTLYRVTQYSVFGGLQVKVMEKATATA